MTIIRSVTDFNRYVDWTSEVEEIPNQYGLLNNMGLFDVEPTITDMVMFDRTEHTIALPETSVRGKRVPSSNKDINTTTFSLPMSFYKNSEEVTSQDIFKARRAGTQEAETLGNAIAKKLMVGREKFDQLQEYLKVQAIKGLVSNSAGTTVTNMFTEYGLTQTSIDFVLGTAGTDVDAKIRQLKTAVTKNAKVGARVGEILVLVDPLFFDKLVGHANIKDAYKHYQNNGSQILRDDLSRYEAWGIVDTFKHRGVMFASYDADFVLSTGSSVKAFADNTGFSVVKGVREAYKQYVGPSDKLSAQGEAGRELFVYEYRDIKDEAHEIQFEAAPLVALRKPQLSVAVTTSN